MGAGIYRVGVAHHPDAYVESPLQQGDCLCRCARRQVAAREVGVGRQRAWVVLAVPGGWGSERAGRFSGWGGVAVELDRVWLERVNPPHSVTDFRADHW